jgi:hypothetical protein
MASTSIDTRGMSRSDLIEQWAKEKGRNLLTRVKSREFQTRVESTGMAVVAAGIAATVPAWILERNPDWQYLDEEKEIETEAVLALGATLGGVAAYVAEIPYGESLMVAGLVMGGCYLNKVVREKARTENAEEAALAGTRA